MFKLKNIVGGAALVLATSALAGGPEVAPLPTSGFYVSGHGGASILGMADPYYTGGWDLGLAFGYHWTNIRVELETSYTDHDERTFFLNTRFFNVNGGGLPIFTPLQTLRVMGNIYYDFDFGSKFVPFIGAGIGWQGVWSKLNLSFNAFPNLNTFWYFQNSNIAFQGLLGLNYKVSDSVRVGINYAANFAIQPNYNILVNNRILNNNVFTRLNTIDNQINLGVTYLF